MMVDMSSLSKTTIFGALSALVVLLQAIKFDVAGHLCMTQRDWVMVVIAVLLFVIGHTQQDAGKQEAHVPGRPGTQLVDSHETPDDPSAKPVVK